MRFGLPLIAAVGLMLPVAVFASKTMAPLFAATVAAMLAGHVFKERSFPPIPPRIGATLGAIVLYAAISSAWSLTPERTLAASVPFAGIMLGIAFLLGLSHRLDEGGRVRVRMALLVGIAVGLMLLLIERASDRALLRAWNTLFAAAGESNIWTGNSNLFSLKPAATITALLVWPTLLSLRQRMSPAPIAATVASMGAVIIFIGSDAAVLSLILGGAVFLLALRWEKIMAPLLGMVLVVFVIGAPWLPPLLPDPAVETRITSFLPNSALHRIYIWKEASALIAEKPMPGHGFDTSRAFGVASGVKEYFFRSNNPAHARHHYAERIPLHPHNMVLQIWLELGAVGAGLTLVALLAVLAALARSRLDRMERAVAYGFFVSALTIAAISYGAWQAWWLSTLGLSGAIFVAVLPSIETPRPSSLSRKVA